MEIGLEGQKIICRTVFLWNAAQPHQLDRQLRLSNQQIHVRRYVSVSGIVYYFLIYTIHRKYCDRTTNQCWILKGNIRFRDPQNPKKWFRKMSVYVYVAVIAKSTGPILLIVIQHFILGQNRIDWPKVVLNNPVLARYLQFSRKSCIKCVGSIWGPDLKIRVRGKY